MFSLDAFGGGFLTDALVAYWFFRRFGIAEESLGLLFFAVHLLNAASHLGAAWLARRIGLVNTMVFTHLPSSLFLVAAAFAPSLKVAVVLFLCREALVEMDVPTRQSYVAAVVLPNERTFASGITNLARNIFWAVGSSVAGFLMQNVAFSAPLVIGGGAKIGYDLLLYRAFRKLKPTGRAVDTVMLKRDKPQPEAGRPVRDSRCPRRHRWHWALCALLATATLASARSDDGPAVKVSATSSASITLDGLLNEPAWRDAPVMKLTQQAPKPGQPTPYETQVQVIVTSDRIYFGFTCKDPDPRHIAIHTMRRDGDLTGDDTVSIVLDTYGDRRTGYFFQINAAGTRVDGLISTADSVSLDWDGIWDARTARTPDGWSAEIVIPSRTLSFTPGLNDWGLNLERFVPRERLWLRWSSPTLDSFLYDLSRAGRLTGVGEVQQGKGLEITPYADRERPSNSMVRDHRDRGREQSAAKSPGRLLRSW